MAKMNTQVLAALLSTIISLVLTLVLLLFPPAETPLISDSFSSVHGGFRQLFFSLLHHFLSVSDVSGSLSFGAVSRKRKRAHLRGGSDDSPGSGLGRFVSVISQNPESFKQLFRMKASTFEWLCGLLEPLLECRDPVESPLNLPTETRLGVGLFRLATGADYLEISRRFRVSEADARFCVKQLCRVLCTNFRFWVGFPSHAELDLVSSRVEALTGLPNCCGFIKCNRFNIQRTDRFDSIKEAIDQEESIAAQIVVDASSKILSVTAGFRGSKSDLRILKSSNLFEDIEKGVLLNSQRHVNVDDVSVPQYLIGDGDYTLLPWLIVPFADPEPGSIEENFNNVHRLMRVSWLKAIASLKSWGVLSRPVDNEYKIAVACIGACSILHNMLVTRDDYSAFCNELDGQEMDDLNRVSLDGNLIEEKALSVRKALATRAKMNQRERGKN